MLVHEELVLDVCQAADCPRGPEPHLYGPKSLLACLDQQCLWVGVEHYRHEKNTGVYTIIGDAKWCPDDAEVVTTKVD